MSKHLQLVVHALIKHVLRTSDLFFLFALRSGVLQLQTMVRKSAETVKAEKKLVSKSTTVMKAMKARSFTIPKAPRRTGKTAVTVTTLETSSCARSETPQVTTRMVAIESFTVYGNGRLCDPVLDHELRQKEEALITAARQMTTSAVLAFHTRVDLCLH